MLNCLRVDMICFLMLWGEISMMGGLGLWLVLILYFILWLGGWWVGEQNQGYYVIMFLCSYCKNKKVQFVGWISSGCVGSVCLLCMNSKDLKLVVCSV